MDVATKTRSPAGQPGSVKAQLAVGAKLVDAGEVLTLRSRVALPAGGGRVHDQVCKGAIG